MGFLRCIAAAAMIACVCFGASCTAEFDCSSCSADEYCVITSSSSTTVKCSGVAATYKETMGGAPDCVEVHDSGYCAPRKREDERCSPSEPCLASLACYVTTGACGRPDLGADGDPCNDDHECSSTHCRRDDLTKPGSCAPFAVAHEACDSDHDCAPGLVCFASSDHTCHEKPTACAPCDSIWQCDVCVLLADGAYPGASACLSSALPSNSDCDGTLPVGAPCASARHCATGKCAPAPTCEEEACCVE